MALLLERDGPACWLCTRALSTQATKPGRRITLEHLTPRCAGGDDGLANLVLCHEACNRHLRDHCAEKKWKIRAKWHREAARLRKSEVQPARRPPAEPASLAAGRRR